MAAAANGSNKPTTPKRQGLKFALNTSKMMKKIPEELRQMNGVNSEKSDLSKSPKVQAKGNINVNNHNNNNNMMK